MSDEEPGGGFFATETTRMECCGEKPEGIRNFYTCSANSLEINENKKTGNDGSDSLVDENLKEDETTSSFSNDKNIPLDDKSSCSSGIINRRSNESIPSDKSNDEDNSSISNNQSNFIHTEMSPCDMKHDTPIFFTMDEAAPPLPLSHPPCVSEILESSNQTSLLNLEPNLYSLNSPQLKPIQDKMISGLDQFFDYSSSNNIGKESNGTESEIAKILADFNEILNSDDPYVFSIPENEEFITSTVEAFTELLIGAEGNNNEENELLIIVDDSQSESCDENESETPKNEPIRNEPEEEYFEEGYESDLPMVRKSMRKLRPVSIPIASTSSILPHYGHSSGVPIQQQPIISQTHLPVRLVTNSTIGTTRNTTTTTLTNNNGIQPAYGHGHGHGHEYESQAAETELRSIEDNNATVLTVNHSETVTPSNIIPRVEMPHQTISISGSSRSSGSREEGCVTFRPTTDLVFSNLHVVPPDLTEALAADGDDTATTTTTTNETSSRNRRQSNNNGTSVVNPRSSPGRWPHRLSSVLALIGCTLGLTNICRFGSLSVQYGANFTLQFTFLSLVFGIPLFLFHMSIGQYLAAGIVDMWKISPIFQGIGIGLVMSQAMIGIYTAVGVSWMFIYFRDSFIPRFDQYRWGKCFRDYRACDQNLFNNSQLAETVPDYFNGVVLQRSSPEFPSSAYIPSSIKFTVAFNLAVVWMLVFVSLSKGLKSYGKVIHGFILIPITAMLVLASKMVGLVPSEDAGLLFGQTSWENFFFNTQTWMIAAREVFFTWGLFGACVMQITAHNRSTHSLKSDATIIVLITTFVLLLTTFLSNACYYVLQAHGYDYVPSSFESEQSFKFLVRKQPDTVPIFVPPHLANQHTTFLMGVRIIKPDIVVAGGNMVSGIDHNVVTVSGYQALRLATELFPATMALLGSQGLSPFWTVLFYFTFILFGLAQQLAIWYTVIKGVIAIKPKILKSWETTISFSICAIGFVLGLPLCTEYGIFVEYFLDYTIGSGWWIMVLYLLELVAVFIVRGAPYCGENIVTVIFSGGSKLSAILAPVFSFVWNVILPVAILILSISSFKNGNFRELYDWNPSHGYIFWPSWTRELGSLLQLLPILTVPFVAIIQSCRYLTNGPPDLLDRIQLLYRPHSRGIGSSSLFSNSGRATTNFPSRTNSEIRINEDPPPKYTPPPSYSAVTGAKIAKFLRNSIRRSIRRFSTQSPSASPAHSSTESLPPPPNYSSVILEINRLQNEAGGSSGGSRGENSKGRSFVPILISPPPEDNPGSSSSYGESLEPGKRRFEINITQNQSRASTLGRNENSSTKQSNCSISSYIFGKSPSSTSHLDEEAEGQGSQGGSNEKISLRRIASDITPGEVARILRASFRRSTDEDGTLPGISYVNPNGNSDSTYQSHHDESIDSLTIINQDTVNSTDSSGSFVNEHGRSTSIPRNHNFDFSSRSCRNRRSNDSQLGLLASHLSNSCTNSRENLNYFGLMSMNSISLGIVNPTFQLTEEAAAVAATGGENGNLATASGSSTSDNKVHLRTNSLTVPVIPFTPPTNRHHQYHRTN